MYGGGWWLVVGWGDDEGGVGGNGRLFKAEVFFAEGDGVAWLQAVGASDGVSIDEGAVGAAEVGEDGVGADLADFGVASGGAGVGEDDGVVGVASEGDGVWADGGVLTGMVAGEADDVWCHGMRSSCSGDVSALGMFVGVGVWFYEHYMPGGRCFFVDFGWWDEADVPACAGMLVGVLLGGFAF